jgi:hypothetical protein
MTHSYQEFSNLCLSRISYKMPDENICEHSQQEYFRKVLLGILPIPHAKSCVSDAASGRPSKTGGKMPKSVKDLLADSLSSISLNILVFGPQVTTPSTDPRTQKLQAKRQEIKAHLAAEGHMRKFDPSTGREINDKRINGERVDRRDRRPGDWRAEMVTLPLVGPVRELQAARSRIQSRTARSRCCCPTKTANALASTTDASLSPQPGDSLSGNGCHRTRAPQRTAPPRVPRP